MSDSIKIMVRVRPFNENQRGQTNVVEMEGQEVRLKNPESGQQKKFGFHRCYWSTDGSQGKPAVNNMFVFNDIGREILENIYQGYNSTVFAYGQTGSGKSYSIEGYEEKGLLQLCLEDIFSKKKKENEEVGISTSVKVTYLEIYNEKLRDLLNPKSDGEIKVQSAGTAVFIQGVEPVICQSYEEVERLFKDGKKIRVIGAHAMNKTSSRSHAIFTILYKELGKGKKVEAKFNIVDLAGSERQSKTGATGVRLQEANNINLSLTNLGIVIETLANNCIKKQNNHVPYRNSLLTHILSQSLAGNSKTFMIAAISPASSNYEETLSTLRFAQRASMISTHSKKNVEQKELYNKELLQEIERLKRQLQKKQGKTKIVYEPDNVQLQKERLEKAEAVKKLQFLQKEYEEMKGKALDREKEFEEELKKELRIKLEQQQQRKKALEQAGFGTESVESNDTLPYIMNISEDPSLAGMLIYHLKEGQTKIGTKDSAENTIKMNALGISKRHCTITSTKAEIVIEACSKEDRLFVNGIAVLGKKTLRHLDRITLGHANTFKLVIPGQKLNVLQSVAKFGQFLDDRLNADSPQAKNTKTFLQQLELRLEKDTFARFIEKFKVTVSDLEEANDFTAMRYKKYPLTNRNIVFKLNVIIDIQNYVKGQPTLIIICNHKETGNVQFVWTEEKFQQRFAQMQMWYSDVSGGNKTQSTFYEFDPWFDATDSFIKQKQKIQLMNARQIYQFWNLKQQQNAQNYKNLLQQQKDVLLKLSGAGVKEDIVEYYADFHFRGYEIDNKYKQTIQNLRNNEKVHKLIKRFMQICAQIQKCNIDNKAYNQSKAKYDVKKPNNNNNSKGGEMPSDYNQILQENAWYNQNMYRLENQIKKLVQQNKRLKNKS